MVERWRLTGCATSFLNQPHPTAQPLETDRHKLFLKFKSHQIGYEALITDFNGHLWRETLFGSDLQERLKSEASGLEIETADLISLLDQMCENFIESTCETSSDLKNLILRTSVKVGFIKLKWIFKADLCDGYVEMIKEDFLMPFFANLKDDDRVVRDEINENDLENFYKLVNVKKASVIESREEIVITESVLSATTLSQITTTAPSNWSSQKTVLSTQATLSPPPRIIEPEESPDTEEKKRKALEEQLQASKKKKKNKLI